MYQGVVPLASLQQELSQIEMGPPFIGFTVDGGAERDNRASVVPLILQAVAEIVVSQGEIGLELRRLAKASRGRDRFLLQNQSNPQIEVGFGNVRPQLGCFPQRPLRGEQIVNAEASSPNHHPGPGRVGVILNRSLKQPERLLMLSLVDEAVCPGKK